MSTRYARDLFAVIHGHTGKQTVEYTQNQVSRMYTITTNRRDVSEKQGMESK